MLKNIFVVFQNLISILFLVTVIFREETETEVKEPDTELITNREKFHKQSKDWISSGKGTEQHKPEIKTEQSIVNEISKQNQERGLKPEIPGEKKEETETEKKDTEAGTEDVIEIERDGKKVKISTKTGQEVVEEKKETTPGDLYKIGNDTVDQETIDKVKAAMLKGVGKEGIEKMSDEAIAVTLEHYYNYQKHSAAMNDKNIEAANRKKEQDKKDIELEAKKKDIEIKEKRYNDRIAILEKEKSDLEALKKIDPDEISNETERQRKITEQVLADQRLKDIESETKNIDIEKSDLLKEAKTYGLLGKMYDLQEAYPELQTRTNAIKIIIEVENEPDDFLDNNPELEAEYRKAKGIQELFLDWQDTDQSMTIKKFYRLNKHKYSPKPAQSESGGKPTIHDLRKDQTNGNLKNLFKNQKTPDEAAASTGSQETPTGEKTGETRIPASEFRKKAGWGKERKN